MWLIFVPLFMIAPWIFPVSPIGLMLLDAYFDAPGEQPFADNPSVVIASNPVEISEAREIGWPTGRDDGPTDGADQTEDRIFNTYVGVETLGFPGWMSCEDRICLVEIGDKILLYDTYPDIDKIAEIDEDIANPFDALVAASVTQEQAARLLTP